jgi:transcriptional regulator with XRE-family HTH domain
VSEFGRRLAELRAERGWSQGRLAAAANVDQSFVSRLESGNRLPERDTVLRLLDALDAPALDREHLLAAAGFRSEALDDPLLAELVALCVDPSVPRQAAEDIRTLVRVAVEHGRRAKSS